MQRNTTLSDSIDASGTKARYDAACKKILAEKIILAWIMKNTMKEYASITVQEIVDRYIVGIPEIAKVKVLPDQTNPSRVEGIGVEDTSCTEGMVTYDIRFQAVLPQAEEIVGLIINVEAQNDFYPGYPLIKRGIYYCSRMISSQYGTVFTKSEYAKIKKVYSIWICLNPPKERHNTITRYHITEENLFGDVREKVEDYDLLTAIMICLGDEKTGEKCDSSLLNLLDVLLSNQTDAETKKEILEKDFDIPMTEQLEKGVDEMCNLSDGVWNEAMEKGIAQGIEQGMAQGIEQGIEQGVQTSLKNLISNMHFTVDQAMEALGISAEDKQKYSALLSK